MERPPNDIPLPELARLTVERFVVEGAILEPPLELQGILAEQAGVFVTLRTSDGQLRGASDD